LHEVGSPAPAITSEDAAETPAERSDGGIVWSKSYPVAGADPAKIAAEVDSQVPLLEEEGQFKDPK